MGTPVTSDFTGMCGGLRTGVGKSEVGTGRHGLAGNGLE